MAGDEQHSPPPDANALSVTRTMMAADRTLLAWIRTALSLFGFGFTLAHLIQGYIQSGALKGFNAQASKHFGITLLFLAIGCLVCGAIEHRRALKTMNISLRATLLSPSLLMTAALALVGIFLLAEIFSTTR